MNCIYCKRTCINMEMSPNQGYSCLSCPGYPQYIMLDQTVGLGPYGISFGIEEYFDYWLYYNPHVQEIGIMYNSMEIYKTKGNLESAEAAVDYLHRFLKLKVFI